MLTIIQHLNAFYFKKHFIHKKGFMDHINYKCDIMKKSLIQIASYPQSKFRKKLQNVYLLYVYSEKGQKK